jgi:hypothetical protein
LAARGVERGELVPGGRVAQLEDAAEVHGRVRTRFTLVIG